MFKLIFVSILLFLLVSCYYSSNIDYRNNLKKVPKVLTEHFPQDLSDDKNSSLIMNLDTSSHCLSYFLFEFEKKNISVVEKLEKEKSYLQKFSAIDSNLIVVKRETTLYWSPDKFRDYSLVISNHKLLPIPYFEKIKDFEKNKDINSLFSDKSESGLTNDFTVYVLDYKPGEFWDGLNGLSYMPMGAKNGYSKGIAFNQKRGIIIFWFVVW